MLITKVISKQRSTECHLLHEEKFPKIAGPWRIFVVSESEHATHLSIDNEGSAQSLHLGWLVGAERSN